MIRSMIFTVGFSLIAIPCWAQDATPDPAQSGGQAEAPAAADVNVAPAAVAPAIVPPSYVPYVANYGANYYYPYYAYAPGYVFPAYT
ncbi:MAG: hypothetical protein KDA84_15045, partial [Planctomycetaceae bacterium]|nr:hypothetical protein [Planctomycetaceae bacterium]